MLQLTRISPESHASHVDLCMQTATENNDLFFKKIMTNNHSCHRKVSTQVQENMYIHQFSFLNITNG
jgi:hypothetical protein